MVQKGVGKSYSADQGQHNAELVKTKSHRNSGHLKGNDGVEHHHHQSGKIILGKGNSNGNVEDRHQKLAQWVQRVNGRAFCRQSVHFSKLRLGLEQFIHSSAPCKGFSGIRVNAVSIISRITRFFYHTSGSIVSVRNRYWNPPGGMFFAEIKKEECWELGLKNGMDSGKIREALNRRRNGLEHT